MAGHSNPLTPLRYPGGKGAFAPYIKQIILKNNLINCNYIEPFAGGAAIALDLLFNDVSREIHINDYDPAIYNFWNSIVNESSQFIDMINFTDITIEEWERQRQIICDKSKSSIEIGFAAFFLNRTNRSGILNAGVIGGKKQDGQYKIDARFKKEKLITRIKKIAQFKSRIHIYNFDAVDFINRIDNITSEESLIYLDPPYYKKGKGLYRNFYNHDDHILIRDSLASTKHKWIVSYDNCPEIKEIYNNYRQDEYFLDYCAYKKVKGSEVMIYGPSISIPENSSLKLGS